MYGAVGASISVRQQRKKSLSRQSVKPLTTPAKKAKVHPHLAKTHTATQLPNGKNAWGGRVGDRKRASDAQRRWMNKNKVGDSGGGSLEKRPDGKYRQTGVVNIVLYVGLGLISLGLIITFVGMGEHGFKSPELQLIGPSLIGCGFLFCLLRLFFCSAPACCAICCNKRSTPLDEKSLLSPSRETLNEESAESQQHQQRQQQEQEVQEQEESGSEVPQRLETHEENDHQEARRITSKTARRVQSTIPNLIEDEFDDDADLGLHVEYMDEVGRTLSPKQQGGGSLSSSRASSARSHGSAASKVPRLPDIHTVGRQDPEIVLNPATLEGAVD
ncbi:hypothetical protein O3P69_011468 [Scylla paramamosain]|uniref:Uncharacterized protein n=1 Tax=Scylla paramamosain TaxID=85552 RepID=A0AAW0T979_SCYPA